MDPLTAALAGLDTSSKPQSESQNTQLHALEQQQLQSADAVAGSNGPAAAGSCGSRAAGNHSRNPSSLSIDPLSAAIQDGDDDSDNDNGVAADEQSDTLSPLSSPGAAAAEAAAIANGSSGNGSSSANSSGSGSASRPIAVPLPSLPDPDLNAEELGQLLQRASPAISDTRFSMEEFLKNKSALATAARRELGGGSGTPAADMDDDVGSCLEGSGHEAELARQGEHLSSLLQGVGEECKVNRELAGLLAERLDSSRKALECLLRLVTCLMEAEAAYSSAMSAAAKAAAAGPLAAPADSGGLEAAVEGLVQLPAAAAAGHRQLYLDLQTLVEAVRALWRKYNAAAKELKNSVSTAQRQIDSSCKQLQHCLSEHRAACEAFDAVVVWQSTGHARSSSSSDAAHHQQQQHRRGNSSSSVEAVGDAWTGAAGMAVAALHLAAGSSSGGSGVLRPRFAAAPTRDPWASEGKLAAEQAALQKWQDQERELLQRGFDSLQALEQERVAALMQAGQALAESYSSAVAGMPAAAAMLQGMLGGLGDAGEAGVQHLAQVAADMRATSEQLAARQAEAVCVVSQELFCSPEIIRQGAMELWQPKSSSWAGAHFVLTRAGFLHWFASMEDVTPLEPPLNLCRCSFEAGAAPVFHLVEAGSGGWLVGRGSRKITLQASSVEECCEWAIALREAIALASSTGAAAASSGSAGKSLPSRLSR